LEAILHEGQGVAAMLLQVSGVRWEQVGQALQISVTPDDEGHPVVVPADLQAALQQHPDEQQVFENLSAIKRQQLIGSIERAEGEAERGQAVAGIIELLQQIRQNFQRTQHQQ
jgi:uncharacterized protein YdeI (YjbR/CyaY-like superfamily)